MCEGVRGVGAGVKGVYRVCVCVSHCDHVQGSHVSVVWLHMTWRLSCVSPLRPFSGFWLINSVAPGASVPDLRPRLVTGS